MDGGIGCVHGNDIGKFSVNALLLKCFVVRAVHKGRFRLQRPKRLSCRNPHDESAIYDEPRTRLRETSESSQHRLRNLNLDAPQNRYHIRAVLQTI